MAVYKIRRKAGWPFSAEWHSYCYFGSLHLTALNHVNSANGKYRLVSSQIIDAQACDGSCGCKATAAKRAIRYLVHTAFLASKKLKPLLRQKERKR